VRQLLVVRHHGHHRGAAVSADGAPHGAERAGADGLHLADAGTSCHGRITTTLCCCGFKHTDRVRGPHTEPRVQRWRGQPLLPVAAGEHGWSHLFGGELRALPERRGVVPLGAGDAGRSHQRVRASTHAHTPSSMQRGFVRGPLHHHRQSPARPLSDGACASIREADSPACSSVEPGSLPRWHLTPWPC
jgi:hypothetical protein